MVRGDFISIIYEKNERLKKQNPQYKSRQAALRGGILFRRLRVNAGIIFKQDIAVN
jgi:hypothetical protein